MSLPYGRKLAGAPIVKRTDDSRFALLFWVTRADAVVASLVSISATTLQMKSVRR
jgi:hypothetical protein